MFSPPEIQSLLLNQANKRHRYNFLVSSAHFLEAQALLILLGSSGWVLYTNLVFQKFLWGELLLLGTWQRDAYLPVLLSCLSAAGLEAPELPSDPETLTSG